LQRKYQSQNKAGYSHQKQGAIAHIVTLPQQFLKFKRSGKNLFKKTACKIGQLANFSEKFFE
jgi:hypothetical protein